MRCRLREGDRLRAENETLRSRIARLTEAILRISEDLDLDTVLQEVVDGARSLVGARYGAILIFDESGNVRDFITSGVSPEERERVGRWPSGLGMLGYLNDVDGPVRLSDVGNHPESVGVPSHHPPIGTFLGTQIRGAGSGRGNIYLAGKEDGREFTPDDEETLEMFAAQAAVAITNATRYGEEQRAKADIEALVNTSPVGVLVFDARTREVVKFNREARRIIGGERSQDRSFEQLCAMMTFQRIDGQEIPRDELPLERSIRAGETVRAEQVIICLPNGQRVSTLVNSTPIHSSDGQVDSAVVTIQDTTPLEELERLRAEFLGMVSHELRGPLTSIKGSAATALRASAPLDPAETHQFFRIIEEQADHMRDLISNLLDLTRIEAGTLSISPEQTDLAVLIDQAKNAFLSGGYRNSVEVDLPPDLPPVRSDSRRIVQVLYNLLTNASKFSHEWSPIHVTAVRQDPYVAVSTTDGGRGIAPDRLLHLFGKFSRVDGDARDERSGGYGLGLAICKGIVEAHGGRIWAESDGHGSGTRFTFTIPTVDETRSDPAVIPDSAPPAAPDSPVVRERVLVIDDDPQVLRYVRNTLTEAGYRPTLTGDPDEMDRLLQDEKPDLVLLNLVLPGIDGFDLMARIPDIFQVPVIVLSGRGKGHDITRAFEMGASDYVVKPFSPTELVARIRAALRKRALPSQPEPFQLADVAIDYAERRVTVAGQPAPITPTEYKLLFELSTNAGRVLTHDQLLQRVWGEGRSADLRILRSFVKSLRSKLGDDARNPSYVFTEPGVGYRLAKPD